MKKAIILLAPLLMVVGLNANSKKVDPEESVEITTISERLAEKNQTAETNQTVESEQNATVKKNPIAEKTSAVLEGTTIGKYAKPGAPIDMSYKTTRVAANQSANVDITLTTTAQEGTMSMRMTLDEKLTLLNNVDANQTFEIHPNEKTFLLNVKVSAKEDGLYYIRLLTKIDKGHGVRLRSFAVPVYIGDNPRPKNKAGTKILKATSGENISVSKAIETVEVIKK